MPRRRTAAASEVHEQGPVPVDLTQALPAELLCEIFDILAACDAAHLIEERIYVIGSARTRKNRVDRHASRLRGWFVITHVNARWRALALGRSSLWTSVDINLGPSWVSAFIARSDPLLFVFRTESRRISSIESWTAARIRTFNEVLSQHAHRVRQLDVHSIYHQPQQVPNTNAHTIQLPRLFFRDYPALETLCWHENTVGIVTQSWSSLRLPQLRRLSLHGPVMFAAWKSLSPSHLTHLVVRENSLGGSGVEKANVEAHLPSLAALEYLYLDGVVPHNAVSDHKLCLPRLQRLGLRDGASNVLSFMQALEAPSLLHAETSYCRHDMDRLPFGTLISATLAHVPADAFTALTLVRSAAFPGPRAHVRLRASCDIEFARPVRLYLDEYLSENTLTRRWTPNALDAEFLALDSPHHRSDSHDSRVLELSANTDWGGGPDLDPTHDPVHLPFPNVQTVCLAGTWDPQALTEAFSLMSNVKHIRLYDHNSFAACCSAMSADTALGAEPSTSRAFAVLPRLETLAIAFPSVSGFRPKSVFSEYCGSRNSNGVSIYDRLRDLVKARAAIGRPIRAVYLHQADEFMSSFRKHVRRAGEEDEAVLGLIEEDQGPRRWFDVEKQEYVSNNPEWR
ncbi:unnamed protein product [Peniophora sp. CBMAI 1063]|nr:unnamed protein product [Peniophora sp. CBMAI 1063]